MYQVQKQKGITLIALVITVIVLIILAGVAINLTLGENGILRRAEDAQKLSDEQAVKEKVETAVLQVQIEEVTNEGTLTLQKLYETLASKDTNITLNQYAEADTFLSGTYTLEGTTYSFTINEEFEVIVGEEAEVEPVQTEETIWNDDGTITLTLSSKISDSIEYQVNATEEDGWIEGTTVTGLEQGDIVYVRVNDGETVTEVQEIEIKDTIAPEEFEITTSDVTAQSLKISGSTVDNQTGLATYSYVAATSASEIVKEITNQTVTEYTITGLAPETEYVVYMLAYDNAGNVRKSNEVTLTTPEIPVDKLIGQYVNYGIDLDDDGDTTNDWQIFYKEDDPTSPNYGATYIIPDYYVPYSKMETSVENAGMSLYNSSSTYRVRWSSIPTYEPITDEVRQIFMYDYTQTSNENVKCVSRLLDTMAWDTDFVTPKLRAKGGMATGGPTINMWAKSLNKKYLTTTLLTATIKGTGYIMSNFKHNNSDIINFDNVDYRVYKEDAPNVYFPTLALPSDSTYKYWLASPSSADKTGLIRVGKDGIVQYEPYATTQQFFGLRPLVYLPASVKLEPSGIEEVWNINYGE